MYKVVKNQFNIPEELLFCIGKRDNNKKRSFLFISKLLGKHLSVNPDVVKSTGFLLSSLKYGFNNATHISCIKGIGKPSFEEHAFDKNVLVIGFCETATALGMSVASSIHGSSYITTTRETIHNMKQLLRFEEPHSHASTHCLYSDSIDLNRFKEIILVDDEITTGISLLNLIKEIVKNSSVRKFSIMTILDWRNESMKYNYRKYISETGIEIYVYSLLSGYVFEENTTIYKNKNVTHIEKTLDSISLNIFSRQIVPTLENPCTKYVSYTGRFGIDYECINKVEVFSNKTANEVSNYLGTNKRILILGQGENIYIPSRVAFYLQNIGYEVSFRTTSRTPIYCDGEIIKDVQTFDDRGVIYHFYNREEAEKYDKVIMLADTPFNKMICNNLMIFNL